MRWDAVWFSNESCLSQPGRAVRFGVRLGVSSVYGMVSALHCATRILVPHCLGSLAILSLEYAALTEADHYW